MNIYNGCFDSFLALKRTDSNEDIKYVYNIKLIDDFIVKGGLAKK